MTDNIDATQLDNTKNMLKRIYNTFNQRNIDDTLSVMHPEVDWPNGMEGGIEHGHNAVRNYWTRQWTMINPRVVPIDFTKENDGRIKVTVHQVVHDLNGKLLVDQNIFHVYEFEDDLVKSMEIKQVNDIR